MKKILFSSNFRPSRNILIFLLSLFFFPELVETYINIRYPDFSLNWLLTIVLYAISVTFFLVLFIKKGIVLDCDKLYKAQFLFGIIIYKKEVPLADITDVSILKFRGKRTHVDYHRQDAILDSDYIIERNEIYVLNKTHTVKKFVIHTENSEFAKKAAVMIRDYFNFNYKPYSPKFPNTGRRRKM